MRKTNKTNHTNTFNKIQNRTYQKSTQQGRGWWSHKKGEGTPTRTTTTDTGGKQRTGRCTSIICIDTVRMILLKKEKIQTF